MINEDEKQNNQKERPLVKCSLETEKYIVLFSDRVILDQPDTELILNFSLDEKATARIVLRFIRDEKESGIALESSNDELHILCYNFEEPLGRFTVEPIEIGMYKGKRLKMQVFSSLSRGQKSIRQVVYTLFMEK